jgi:hypothetical protein
MWFRRRDKRSNEESRKAILESTQKLREVRERDPEVHAVAQTLKSIRERNHFAEQLRIIMEGG